MKTILSRSIALLIHLLITSLALAQVGTGILVGIVVDESNGEPIPFANVIVLQQDQQVTGASTDFDGRYKIAALKPASDYVVKVSVV